jgi:serine/threonine-protein kinase
VPFPTTLPAAFGRYRLLRKLGEGGMGAVFLAEDTRLKRQVALKVPRLDAELDRTVIDRFEREAQVAAGIDHPNLCPVHDVGEIDGTLFLTMPLIDGESLARHTGKPWPPDKAVALVRRLAGALAVLHGRGVLHRDLKPSNVMLRRGGSPVLMDFGLAHGFHDAATRLTRDGARIGTPAFMAPEQADGQGRRLSPATDVYGLGVVLYELLTGEVPFVAPSVEVLLAQILRVPPKPPSVLRPSLPPGLDAVCLKALAKDPARRYVSMAEFAAALDAALASPTGTTDPGGAPTGGGSSEPVPDALPADSRPAGPRAKTTRLAPAPERRKRARLPAVVVGILGVLAVLVAVGMLAAVGVLSDNRPHDTGRQAATTAGSPDPWPGETRPGVKTEGGPARGEPARASAPFDAAKAKELQRAWAAYLGRPVEDTLDLGSGEKLVVVLIPPGTFRMGSPPDESDRNPLEMNFDAEAAHRVTLTRPFYLGKYEVTQAQFEAVMGKDMNKSWFSPQGGGADKVKGMPTERFPVEEVLWEDADAFCAALAKKAGKKVTLPTEAQWEYACRAGTQTPFHFGRELNGTQANCGGDPPYGTNTKGPWLERTTEVGSKDYPPNAWGLYDVLGNVAEWCRDWYGPYADLPATDPERVDKGSVDARVLRGGSWYAYAWGCRAACRFRPAPSTSYYDAGFRVAVRLD